MAWSDNVQGPRDLKGPPRERGKKKMKNRKEKKKKKRKKRKEKTKLFNYPDGGSPDIST